MTSKVQLICNGESYVIEFTRKNKEGDIIGQGELRGGNQTFCEMYLGQDETILVTEKYKPLVAPATEQLKQDYNEKYNGET